MSNPVELMIPGDPMGKQRPIVTRRGAFTPKKTVNYEKLVQNIYKINRFKKLEGAIKITIKAYFSIPKSTPKKYIDDMKKERIYRSKKIDADNIAKIILDSLNGLAYRDDGQVAILIVIKKYSDTPRMEVTIENI